MSHAFSLCRRLLLRMQTRDCQGSVIVHSEVLRKFAAKVRSENYFFTTELVYLLERAGYMVREVPVKFLGEKRPSTIRPVRHGSRMLVQVLQLAAARN